MSPSSPTCCVPAESLASKRNTSSTCVLCRRPCVLRVTDIGHVSPRRGEATRGVESCDGVQASRVGVSGSGDISSLTSAINSDANGVAYAAGTRVVGRSSCRTICERDGGCGGVGKAEVARSRAASGVRTPQSRSACAMVSHPTRTHSKVYSRQRT